MGGEDLSWSRMKSQLKILKPFLHPSQRESPGQAAWLVLCSIAQVVYSCPPQQRRVREELEFFPFFCNCGLFSHPKVLKKTPNKPTKKTPQNNPKNPRVSCPLPVSFLRTVVSLSCSPGPRERYLAGQPEQQLGGQPADHAGGQPQPQRLSPVHPGPPGGSVPRTSCRQPKTPGSPPLSCLPPPEPAGSGALQPTKHPSAPAQPQQRRQHQPRLHPPRLHGPLGRGRGGQQPAGGWQQQRALGDPQQPLADLPLLTPATGADAGEEVQQHQQPPRQPLAPPPHRPPRQALLHR